MLWLGIEGRRKIKALEERCSALEDALEKTLKEFRALDLEMASQIDRLTGLAKRIQGRRGGRPPGQQNGEAEPETQDLPLPFNRHVL